MNTAPELVDNQANFDMIGPDATSDQQEHGLKIKSNEEAMVLKLTHPPTNVPELIGLPTQDARTQVLTQWRNNDILKVPIVPDSGGWTSGNWVDTPDYGFIIPNGARVQYIGCTYGEGTDSNAYGQDIANTKIQDNFNFNTWESTVNLYRPLYKSTTLYANVTALNNVGSINVQQFNPNILFRGSILYMSYENVMLFHDWLDTTMRSFPDRITSDERDTHPDFNSTAIEAFKKKRGLKSLGIKLDPNTQAQVVNIGNVGYTTDTSSLVPTPSQIMSNSMRSYAEKFVNGAFVVQRLNTGSPEWLAGSSTNAATQGLYECYTFTISYDGSRHMVALLEGVPTPAGPLLDTLWSKDMTWAFVRMQGLLGNSPPAGSNSDTAPILMKQYMGYEAQPVWNGPWNGLSRVSPKPNVMALQDMMTAFYEMPDAMAAKYNAWGAILPFLGQLLPKAIDWIGGLFSKKNKNEQPQDTTKSLRQTQSKLAKLESSVGRLQLEEEQLKARKTKRKQSKSRTREKRIERDIENLESDSKPVRKSRSRTRRR